MHVTNTGAKVIGFGSVIITPGETKELPKGYDENHPVVKFYMSKGFLVAASPAKAETTRDKKSKEAANSPAEQG